MRVHKISRHALTRMNQRGLRHQDLDLVTRYGTWTGDQEVFLSRRDVQLQTAQLKGEIGRLLKRGEDKLQRRIRSIKRRIQDLERLCGCKVVLTGDTVATCYHTSKKHQRQMLRFARSCAA